MPYHEVWHRSAFIAIALLTMFVAGYHRFAARRGGPVSRAGEGLWLFLAIRLSGLALFAAVLLLLAAPEAVAWGKLHLPEAVRWSGAAVALGNVAFLGWTLSALGGNLTDTVATRAGHTLVTHGPYRWVRHPFYLAALLAATGLSLLADHFLLALCGAVTFTLLLVRAPLEESALEQRFGDAYRDYRARTGAVLPRWRRS